MKLRIKFSRQFQRDLKELNRLRPKLMARLRLLMEECEKYPFEGIGEPHAYTKIPKCFARKIMGKHRLLYHVDNGEILFLRCLGHYDDH
jgi:Txe/YoeB family toxin of toxin-antitoxin system